MELSDETTTDLLRRLRKVEGQVRGIQQMITDQRDCRDVVIQMSAASKALDQAGFLMIAAGLEWCVTNPKESEAEGYSLQDVQKMFMKLA